MPSNGQIEKKKFPRTSEDFRQNLIAFHLSLFVDLEHRRCAVLLYGTN